MESDESQSFVLQRKLQFFSLRSNSTTVENSLNTTVDIPEDIPDFQVLYKNSYSLELEMEDILHALKKMNNAPEVLWDYGLYCCDLLESLYLGYGHKSKLHELRLKRRNLQMQKEGNSSEKIHQPFLEKCLQDFRNELISLRTLVLHPTALSQKIAVANFARLYWVFLRLFLETGFSMLQKANVLAALEKIFKQHINVDKLIRYLEIPTTTLNYLSVAMFGGRLLINAGIIFRHVCFPTEDEKKLSWQERLKAEWKKRHADMLNHFAWMLINFVTNFRTLFHLSASLAGGLTVLFISIDLLTLYYIKEQAKKEYLTKKNEYNAEKRAIKALMEDDPEQLEDDPEQLRMYLAKLRFIDHQLDSLEINWKAKKATIHYLMIGVSVLMLAFGVMLVANPMLVVLGSFFVGVISAAMFLSEKEFYDWQLKRYQLESAKTNGENTTELEKEVIEARNAYIGKMLKYTLMPGLILATSLVFWPAGVTLAAIFIVYEVVTAIVKHYKEQQNESSEEDLIDLELDDNDFEADEAYEPDERSLLLDSST